MPSMVMIVLTGNLVPDATNAILLAATVAVGPSTETSAAVRTSAPSHVKVSAVSFTFAPS